MIDESRFRLAVLGALRQDTSGPLEEFSADQLWCAALECDVTEQLAVEFSSVLAGWAARGTFHQRVLRVAVAMRAVGGESVRLGRWLAAPIGVVGPAPFDPCRLLSEVGDDALSVLERLARSADDDIAIASVIWLSRLGGDGDEALWRLLQEARFGEVALLGLERIGGTCVLEWSERLLAAGILVAPALVACSDALARNPDLIGLEPCPRLAAQAIDLLTDADDDVASAVLTLLPRTGERRAVEVMGQMALGDSSCGAGGVSGMPLYATRMMAYFPGNVAHATLRQLRERGSPNVAATACVALVESPGTSKHERESTLDELTRLACDLFADLRSDDDRSDVHDDAAMCIASDAGCTQRLLALSSPGGVSYVGAWRLIARVMRFARTSGTVDFGEPAVAQLVGAVERINDPLVVPLLGRARQ